MYFVGASYGIPKNISYLEVIHFVESGFNQNYLIMENSAIPRKTQNYLLQNAKFILQVRFID